MAPTQPHFHKYFIDTYCTNTAAAALVLGLFFVMTRQVQSKLAHLRE